MATYTDWQQRQMDIESGEELDRRLAKTRGAYKDQCPCEKVGGGVDPFCDVAGVCMHYDDQEDLSGDISDLYAEFTIPQTERQMNGQDFDVVTGLAPDGTAMAEQTPCETDQAPADDKAEPNGEGDFTKRTTVTVTNETDEERQAAIAAGDPVGAINILNKVLASEPKYVMIASVTKDYMLTIETNKMAAEVVAMLADEVQTVAMATTLGIPVDLLRTLKSGARGGAQKQKVSALDNDGATPVG